MDRITRHTMFREILQVVEKRSTCIRGQVGALLVKDGRIISMGWNGSPPGAPHCLDAGCLIDEDTGACIRTVHAELNAIAYASRHGIATAGATMYSSLSPCLACAKAIAAAGIQCVVYLQPYRLSDGEQLLVASYGIQCLHLVP